MVILMLHISLVCRRKIIWTNVNFCVEKISTAVLKAPKHHHSIGMF